MARLEYFIVCESSSVDAETHQLSLFHVLDDIIPDAFPYMLPRIDAVGLWILEPSDPPGDLQVLLRVTPPGVTDGPQFPMNFSRGSRRYRAVLTIVNIPLGQSGELEFEILMNGRHAASHSITVHDPGASLETVHFERPQSN